MRHKTPTPNNKVIITSNSPQPTGALKEIPLLCTNFTLDSSVTPRLIFQHIGENLIGTRGLYALTTVLKDGKQLHTLDVSGKSLALF